ncbi:hypothetical protein M433DRAFT_61392 [Acidomyces richmondensis BFW]|nr:MAG: hypothetical protein FE78DRAFT_27417 [Acidomyces sp. 'richmondensis']KYG48316.1 hypothetical protein M433DRAFT_61392 [Acidomyces richmondensis BFW]
MPDEAHWLDDYASPRFEWRELIGNNGKRTFYRPLGLVEAAFDADGRFHEGRADLNVQLDLNVRFTGSRRALRERIVLAWACLRCRHNLLQARATPLSEILQEPGKRAAEVCFVVDVAADVDEAVADAEEQLIFLEDQYENVDPGDFWVHCQNVARVVNPARALAKVFVHPLVMSENGKSTLRLLTVGAHEICEGLSMYAWQRDMTHHLNKSIGELHELLRSLIEPKTMRERLPVPQEALYPPIYGSRARSRWYWLLTRLLRHVRKPLEAGFSNPLYHRFRSEPFALSPTYAAVLDYTKVPPLNTAPCFVHISLHNTQRLHRLCREAQASIGAGCFALAALVMMEMYEQWQPDIPLVDRRPFISGFPVNPRPFFNHHDEPDSLMLAFCDGIALPFLSSSLDLDGRIRLLARQAHRQLASFQKRKRPAQSEEEIQYMSARGAGRMLANQYISSIERQAKMLPKHLRPTINLQGAYPARPNMTTQTCGISSVGNRDLFIRRGMYDLEDRSKEFVADFCNIFSNVRARDGEFLIGVGGAEDGLYVNASIDASSVDMSLVEQFRWKIKHILDDRDIAERSRL